MAGKIKSPRKWPEQHLKNICILTSHSKTETNASLDSGFFYIVPVNSLLTVVQFEEDFSLHTIKTVLLLCLSCSQAQGVIVNAGPKTPPGSHLPTNQHEPDQLKEPPRVLFASWGLWGLVDVHRSRARGVEGVPLRRIHAY